MKTSPAGRKAISQREGLRLKAYLDTVGVPTIGVGHTSMAGDPEVKMGMTITKAEADAILTRDLALFENTVNRNVRVPLEQCEFDACVSLAFNIGAGAFSKSTVVRKLNADDKAGAADAILLWNKQPELKGRRAAERRQFLGGDGGRMNLTPRHAKRAAGTVGTGLSGALLFEQAQQQIQPLAEVSDVLKWLFIALTVAGLVYGIWKWWKE